MAKQLKLLWLILSGGSMWATYMHAKYFRNDQLGVRGNASPLWTDMMRHYDKLSTLTRCVVGSGHRWFWLDNWTGEILQGPYPVDATLTIAQGLDIIGDLWQLIPERLHGQIRATSRTNEPDKLIFTRSNNETFSTKEFWESSHPRGVAGTWESRI